MKNLMLLLSLVLVMPLTAKENVEQVDKDTLIEVYEFCVNEQFEVETDLKVLLDCINEAVDFLGFQRFPTMLEVEKRIEDEETTP